MIRCILIISFLLFIEGSWFLKTFHVLMFAILETNSFLECFYHVFGIILQKNGLHADETLRNE